MKTVTKIILLISALFLSLSLWANSPLDSYTELAFSFNATGAPEIEAEKVDRFLKDAKAYLRQSDDPESADHILTEAMVKKLKVYQYLFNQMHGSDAPKEQTELYTELSYQTLRGAFSANPKQRELLIFEKEDANLDSQITTLSDITEGLTPVSFFILGTPADVKDFPTLLKKKTQFLKSMARDSRKKNMVAKWTLDYTFKGKEIECSEVTEEFENQCQITKLLIEKNDALGPTNTQTITTLINETLIKARADLQRELNPKELFQLFRVKYDPLGRIAPNDLGKVLPKVVDRFASHVMELQKITSIHGLSLLQAHPLLQKEMKLLLTPHLRRRCNIVTTYGTPSTPATRGKLNCGYSAFGKYGKRTETIFSQKILDEILEETYEKIASEEKRLAKLEAYLDRIMAKRPTKTPSFVSNHSWVRHFHQQKSLNKKLNKKMITEIERRPQSYGAALMEMNEFIPMASFHLVSMIDKISTKNFYNNLKSVGVITALIAGAFLTGPAAIAVGLAITVYELVDYCSKTSDYKSRAASATIEYIDSHTEGSLNPDELKFLSTRIARLEAKVKKYRMYTYFAAAGLVSAPLSIGYILAKSSQKFQLMLGNIKFIEKFARSMHKSSRIQQNVIHYMKVLKIKDPAIFITNMIQTRKHLMALPAFNSDVHMIAHPEKIHLAERAFAGSENFKQLVGNAELTSDILNTMAEIEAVEVNFFTE